MGAEPKLEEASCEFVFGQTHRFMQSLETKIDIYAATKANSQVAFLSSGLLYIIGLICFGAATVVPGPGQAVLAILTVMNISSGTDQVVYGFQQGKLASSLQAKLLHEVTAGN